MGFNSKTFIKTILVIVVLGILLSFASDPRQDYHPNSYPNLYSDPNITLNLILSPTLNLQPNPNPRPNRRRRGSRRRRRRRRSGSNSRSSSRSGSRSQSNSDSELDLVATVTATATAKVFTTVSTSATPSPSAGVSASSTALLALEPISSLKTSLITLSSVSSSPLSSSTKTKTVTLTSLHAASFLSQSSASLFSLSAALSSATKATKSTALTPLPATSFLSQSSASSPTPAALSSLTSTQWRLITGTLEPSAAVSTPSSSLIASRNSSIGLKFMSGTEEMVMNFISSLNRIDFHRETSLQDAVGLLQNAIEQYENESFQERRNGILFKAAIAFENFVLKYGQHHLNESTPLLNKVYSILDLRIQRVFSRNPSDFHLKGSEKQNFISIPSDNFHNNVLVGIVYRNLHEELISTEDNSKLNTMIMAATMDPKPKQLQLNVTLNFRNLKAGDGERFCMFWSGYSEKSPDGWSGEGCHVVRSKSSSEQTECSCNHMTHFAVLVDYSDSTEITETDDQILTILTYVGLSLSIVGLILTIIAYARFTDVYQPLSQIRMSLAGSLGAAQVIFLGGINLTENIAVCVTIAALMQYFLMAAFCWMLVEGIYLYLNVVKVYNINNKMAMYYAMSWGFPAVMVAISLSISAGKGGIQSFVSDEFCWMSPDNEAIWIFVGFLFMIELINLLLLVRVIWEMTTMQPKGKDHIQQIRVGIKACLMLIPLLGVTWLLGLLSPFHKAFVYIFTILNSTQGFLIFLLHCVRNSQIRDRFKRRMNTIFPALNDEKHASNTSQANLSGVGAPKKIKVLPYSNSVFELRQ